jgi:excisionase family DNA binding protein
MKRKMQRVHISRELPVVAASPAEIALMYGISRDLLYQYMRSGQLPSAKVGGRRIIRIADMEAFLDARRNAA